MWTAYGRLARIIPEAQLMSASSWDRAGTPGLRNTCSSLAGTFRSRSDRPLLFKAGSRHHERNASQHRKSQTVRLRLASDPSNPATKLFLRDRPGRSVIKALATVSTFAACHSSATESILDRLRYSRELRQLRLERSKLSRTRQPSQSDRTC